MEALKQSGLAAKRLELADIDSGHWPMLTRPAELARLLAGFADTAAAGTVTGAGADAS